LKAVKAAASEAANETNMLKDLKAFLMRGNVVDLAVAVVIGAAFGAIVASFTADLLTPLLGAIGGQPDFSGWVIPLGTKEIDGKMVPQGIMIGKFINAIVNFVIVGSVLFFVVKLVNKLSPPPAPAPAGPTQEELLTEIRDLLKAKS
jgi:large conductance mechanosensitive channel